MSRAGSILDALVSEGDGVAGVTAERGLRHPDELRASELPRLFVYDPAESVTVTDHQQREVDWTVSALLVTEDGQEETLLLGDAFGAALDANPTLSGAALWAYISASDMAENPQSKRKTVLLEIACRTEEA